MNDIDSLIAELDREAEDVFTAQLRKELEAKAHAWLVDALVQRVQEERHADAHQRKLSRQAHHVESPAERRQRLRRIRTLGLTAETLRRTTERFRGLDRKRLEAEGLLLDPPHKGKEALGRQFRSDAGESLLRDAHDFFYALLFCDESQGVRLPRSRRDFLTVTLPSAKADTLERFMLAVTELQAAGTWLDPEGVSDDVAASNKVLQVEFGDSPDDLVSEGLVATLGLINNLEVNEEILYARIERLERSTLVS